MPDYEVVPEEVEGKFRRRRRPKPRMPWLTIERYGGRLIYVWFGMRFGALMKLFKDGRFSFTLNCIPDTLALLLFVPWNTPLTWISEAKYGKAARTLKLGEPPVFVVGHWRSGTTLLHDLFAADPNLAFPTTYECFFPNHFLLTEGKLDKAFKRLLPKKRPQDDVPVGFDRPQEEEFAMLMLGYGTPYRTMAWPRLGPVDSDYLDFKGVPPVERKKWAEGFMWFYRRLKVKHAKRLVMKSPPNTSRLKLLNELFPGARYVFLARNPINVFSSTVKLWRALYSTQGLHNPPYLDPWLDDYVIETYARMVEAYEEGRQLIPKDHLVELRYEDFVKDPIAAMRDIYTRLEIGGFDQAEGPMRAFLGERAEHAVSRYQLPEPLIRKIATRLEPHIERFGYRDAVEAALVAAAKPQPQTSPARETEPS